MQYQDCPEAPGDGGGTEIRVDAIAYARSALAWCPLCEFAPSAPRGSAVRDSWVSSLQIGRSASCRRTYRVGSSTANIQLFGFRSTWATNAFTLLMSLVFRLTLRTAAFCLTIRSFRLPYRVCSSSRRSSSFTFLYWRRSTPSGLWTGLSCHIASSGVLGRGDARNCSANIFSAASSSVVT